MQRWHVTLGLSVTAVVGLLLAPRLLGMGGAPVAAPTPAPLPEQDVIATPPPATPDGLPLGHLRVAASLDRTAVLAGGDNERFLTITVSAPAALGDGDRRPVDLSVVMDVSGSMAARGKMEEARRSAKALATQMGPADTFSLVVFNDDATTVIPARRMDDPRAVANAIDRIYEGGGTNLYAGMDRGAEQVRRSRTDGAVSRMVVLSDGNANIGITDPGALSRFAADLAADGITVSTVGMGLDYNEDLLAHLADLGGGSYHFVAPGTSMEHVFQQELVNTSTVVGQGTVVHVELPPEVSPVELIGWEGTRNGNGWDVFVGDVYAGGTKKVVARVRVRPTSGQGELAVAAVDARYHDIPDGRDAHTPGATTARVTTDAAAVKASTDQASGFAANRALGSWYLDQSTRAWERGNNAEAQSLAEQATATLRQAAADFDAPGLLEDAAIIEASTLPMATVPASSEAGRVQSKKNKELYRDLSH
jgi:Ca-activated chloride channel family protein